MVFLLFFSFWCFMPKGENIRGINNFLMPWRVCCSRSFMFYPLRVVFVRGEFESRSKHYLCNNATYVLYMCGIWTCIDLCYSLLYNCARMFFYMSITCYVVLVFTCAIIASAAVPHSGLAVSLCGSAAAKERQCRTQLSQQSLLCMNYHLHHDYISDTVCSTP